MALRVKNASDDYTRYYKQPYRVNVTFERRGSVAVPATVHLANSGIWVQFKLVDQTWSASFGTRRGAWKLETTFPAPLFRDQKAMLSPLFFPIYLQVARQRKDSVKSISANGNAVPTKKDRELVENLIEAYRWATFDSDEKLYASAPVRVKPRRTYDPSRPTPDPEGDHVPSFLASLYFSNPERLGEAKESAGSFRKECWSIRRNIRQAPWKKRKRPVSDTGQKIPRQANWP